MAKKVEAYIKLQVKAGQANPSPPVGPALGQRGVNIMEFCKAFNAQTQGVEPGLPIPVVISVYSDRSFTFVMKTPPASVLLRKAVGISKGMFDGTQVGDPLTEGAHIGPVVNKTQYDKIQGLIQSAIDEGAKLETGGTGLPTNVNRGYYIKPTVFSGVTPDMRIAKEEVFGPVATVMTYATLEEGVKIANDTDYGLSAVISGDPEKAATIAPKLRAGMVAVNNWGPAPGVE